VTPIIVVLVLLALVIVLSGSVMRRSRRDWKATRKYHRALVTLGQLNESGPAFDHTVTAPGRSRTDVALPARIRRAQALREQRFAEAEQQAERQRAVSQQGVSEQGAVSNAAISADITAPATHATRGEGSGAKDGAARTRPPGGTLAGTATSGATAVEGFRILGPVSGRTSGEAPVVRARPGAPTGTLFGAPRQPPVTLRGSAAASGNGSSGQTPHGQAHGGDLRGTGAEEDGGANGQGQKPKVVVLGADEVPGGRERVLGGAQAGGSNVGGSKVGAANGHTQLLHRRGRVALVGAAAVVMLGAAVGAVEATGGLGLPNTPAAAKRPAHHGATRSLAAAPATTVPPAPTTTVPPFTLVSNTNGTASYQVSGSPTVVVSAQGPCWIEAHQPNAQGNQILAALMSPGQSETLHAPVFIRMGAPWAVTVTVNGASLPALATGGSPWNLQFQ
jgi:RodZ C-terminal domain